MATRQTSTGKENNTSNTTTVWEHIIALEGSVSGDASKVGDLTQLNTTDKTSIVNAVKEVKTQANSNASSLAEKAKQINLDAVANGVRRKRTLVWNDEFEGTTLDLTKWNAINLTSTPNNELEAYTSRPSNVYVQNSNLYLVANKETYNGKTWTSGEVSSQNLFSFQYGRAEARIKFPTSQGMWPAFWLLGVDSNGVNTWPNTGEVDIMEHTNNNRYVTANLHYLDTPSGTHKRWNDAGMWSPYSATDQFTNQYHVYAVEWTPTKMDFYIDDVMYATYTVPTPTNGTECFVNNQFYLVLNLAVGGSAPGNPDGTTPNTNQMLVDYVRVYSTDDSYYVKGTSLTVSGYNALTGGTASAPLTNVTNITIGAGHDYFQAFAIVTPVNAKNQVIAWSCSNTSVANVGKAGNIYGYTAGTCTVTATTSDGISKVLNITVVA